MDYPVTLGKRIKAKYVLGNLMIYEKIARGQLILLFISYVNYKTLTLQVYYLKTVHFFYLVDLSVN